MSCTPSSYSPSNLNSDGGIASDDQLPANTPLVGEVGQDEVHQMFVSLDPLKAILSVQSRAGLKNPKAKPLLGLLDALHVPRLDSHTFVMNGAKDQLLARLAALDADHLVSLLDASFPYIGVPDLREIPLRVLGLLHPVPSIYLKQLASDTELFEELPLTVKQQVRLWLDFLLSVKTDLFCSFLHSVNQSFIHSFIHSLIHSFTHSFIHSFVYFFVGIVTLSTLFFVKRQTVRYQVPEVQIHPSVTSGVRHLCMLFLALIIITV
eukprot:jgi/Botrbrau1/11207/Bobra.0075s0003.1